MKMTIWRFGASVAARRSSSVGPFRVEETVNSSHPLWKSFLRENYGVESVQGVVSNKEMEKKEMFIRAQMMAHRAVARCRWGGHIEASLDPLGEAREPYVAGPWMPKDQYDTASLFPYSLSTSIRLPHNINLLGGTKKWLTVKQLFTKMKSIYSHSIGVEEIQQTWAVETWVARRLEMRNRQKGIMREKGENISSKLVTLRRLVQAHSLEDWLLTEHPQLASGLGAEILSIALQSLTDGASVYSGQHFNLCMSTKRGRLNVMMNAMRKPPEQVLAPLEDFSVKGRYLDMSDRTCLGLNSSKVSFKSNDPLVLNLLANVPKYPDSQLALLQGKCRADRIFYRDSYGLRVWPIAVHGDEAISSHGQIYEMLRMNLSHQYGVRGAIHLVISDQKQLRRLETPYCTDVVKGTNGLLLHVNSHDIDAVNFCIDMAVEYKSRFFRSAIVNLVCTPEQKAQHPGFFWKSIVGNPFTRSLIDAGKTTVTILRRNVDSLKDLYSSKYNLREFNFLDWVDSPWKKPTRMIDKSKYPLTGISSDVFESGLKTCREFCEKLTIHPSIKSILDQRNDLADKGQITWTVAETLAIFTLIKNRVNVRLVGEEVLYPKNPLLKFRVWRNEALESPATSLFLDGGTTKANFTVCSVPGSENAMLAYEVGFSTATPKCMSIWQGSEGCLSRLQHLIDIYIAGGEVRWLRQISLVMLFVLSESNGGVWRKENCPWRLLCSSLDEDDIDNKGPVERLSNSHLVLVSVSTPANYFHSLLRHVGFNFRKPTAVFISAQLFTSLGEVSDKQDFLTNTKFEEFIPDSMNTGMSDVKRLILCTGWVYSQLVEERKKKGLEGQVAVSRLEQISPFPYTAVAQELERFPKADIVWTQLEPSDRAWYQFVKPRIEILSKNKRKCSLVGRQPLIHKNFTENLTQTIVEKAMTL